MTPVQISQLKAMPVFKELPLSVIESLLESARVITCQPGQAIANPGEHLNYLFAVRSGLVQSNQENTERKIVTSTEHGPGSLIGCLSLIDHKPLDSALVVKNKAEILLIPIEIARKVLMTCQEFVGYLLRQMASVIRKHEDQRRMLAMPNAFQRVYFQILNLAHVDSQADGQSRLPKQDEIAAQVNTSRETVSRAVQNLVRQGIIVKQGHRIQLQRPELLKQLVENGGDVAQKPTLVVVKKSA